MEDDEKYYINVGGAGIGGNSKTQDYAGGYNGGGSSYHWGANDCYNSSGGGATHIATVSGQLKDLSSYKGTLINNDYYNSPYILIVAGGGGGLGTFTDTASCDFCDTGNGGVGGGINGGIGAYGYYISAYGLGGTQKDGGAYTCPNGTCRCAPPSGSFGKGANSREDGGGGSAGGAGWYGGGAGCAEGNGGGGSGYIGSSKLISGGGITKHMTCYSCTPSTTDATRTNSNTTTPSAMATADVAKLNNGYAKITYLGVSI